MPPPPTHCGCACLPAVLPTLKTLQNAVYRSKKNRVAGLQISTRLELIQFCKRLMLPPTVMCRQIVTNPAAEGVMALLGKEYLCVPQDAAAFKVEGACFTGPTQIKWMRQLRDNQFSLHMDGKYKIHHGIWILLSIGTHCLKVVGETKVDKLVTTFVPLVYLFCRNHESTGTRRRNSPRIYVAALVNHNIPRPYPTIPFTSSHSLGNYSTKIHTTILLSYYFQERRRCCRRH
jgi:hypothetical protein